MNTIDYYNSIAYSKGMAVASNINKGGSHATQTMGSLILGGHVMAETYTWSELEAWGTRELIEHVIQLQAQQLSVRDLEIVIDYLPALYKEDTPEEVKQLKLKLLKAIEAKQ